MPLEAKNIRFRYGNGKWILNDFSLSLNPGEVVGLVGPSGCGKTTLARILAGYQKPNRGMVLIDGMTYPVTGYNPVQLVFQHPEKSVNPRWTMQRTLNEGWHPSDHILQALGIEKDWFRRWPNELSGGELQRFCVARALGPQTQYLIADEMTTMLDAITQAQIWQALMETVRTRNLGVILVSHEKPLANRLCSRIIEFDSGTGLIRSTATR